MQIRVSKFSPIRPLKFPCEKLLLFILFFTFVVHII